MLLIPILMSTDSCQIGNCQNARFFQLGNNSDRLFPSNCSEMVASAATATDVIIILNIQLIISTGRWG